MAQEGRGGNRKMNKKLLKQIIANNNQVHPERLPDEVSLGNTYLMT